MPWGGSKGPTFSAYEQLIESGEDIAWYYTMFLNPLPHQLLDELKQKELVIVPELNYQGQFSTVLRSFGVHAESITEYTGLPFKVSDLTKRVSEKMKAVIMRRVTV
jgi:2-oxoglutarate ferredoxin oxidoreductase subunit alpha